MTRVSKRLVASLAMLLWGAQLPAHAEERTALKSMAVGGSLMSWAWLAWQGAPIDSALCTNQGPRGLRFEATKDRELHAASLGWRLGECTAWRSQALALQLAPRLQLGAWQARQGEPRHLVDAAFIPALRWDLGAPAAGLRLDLELGIGAGFISHSRIGARQKSTNFQFFDVMGLGLRSADARWRLSLDYRHVSNADIRKPNQAVDLVGLSLEVPMP
ncbi:acyloxyacyl hydrolase [Paucibacter sp. DJ1R-11]|uniref:acyloxyacyl hydrolase n=1 Tax=Paucibacter sp. DJ1R-11 TaxID=2893556 RepID=UPI0021E41CB4|nr:acyloxyacyl hydrolase [Paucibacter sp. DJ1R-11]MCV2363249.1 acyloxyacyl hydrolase [Paucibacter sp. DJ1R-11]